MSMYLKRSPLFLACEATYEAAQVVLFGAPFDGTTSYRPGTRDASRVMRAESFSLESYSPYQDKDLTDLAIHDGGDLDLPFGNPHEMLVLVEQQVAKILADGKRPLMLGGEHLVTLGAVRAAVQKYPDLAVIQLDAHLDLRDHYLGQALSHATVMRRCFEYLAPDSLFQLGVRSGDRSEWVWGKETVWRCPFSFDGLTGLIPRLMGRPIYLTLDLDVLDPAVFPGTGTPEAGGVSFEDLLDAIKDIQRLNVIGCDMTELAPALDPSGASTAVALNIWRELILAWSLDRT